jgi:hypothetical protein
MPLFRQGGSSGKEYFNGKHRLEHWYRDNTIYFITARCRDGVSAFDRETTKSIFWDRFDHYTGAHGYTPIVTTLMSNHYHSLGYLRVGEELGEMMRKLHGSVAKLVNDTLDRRLVPFWNESGKSKHNYFDGCIRDELQMRRAYRYTLMQAVRARIVTDWRAYRHTRVNVELEPAVRRATALKAFLRSVPYKRYDGSGPAH